jgi:hypothetical protein
MVSVFEPNTNILHLSMLPENGTKKKLLSVTVHWTVYNKGQRGIITSPIPVKKLESPLQFLIKCIFSGDNVIP